MEKVCFLLEELDCPHCAEKIRAGSEEISGVKSADMNFISKRLTLLFEGNADNIESELRKIVKKLEPDVNVVVAKDTAKQDGLKKEYLLENLDCPHCGEKIADRVGKLDGVSSSVCSFVNKKLTVMHNGSNLNLENEIKSIVAELEPDVNVKPFSVQTLPQKSYKGDIIRLCISGVFFIMSFIIPNEYAKAGMALAAYFIAGYDVLWSALRNLLHGEAFDESLLMTIATVGAIALKDFSEGAAVMLFFQTGELFQNIAVDRSRKSITKLMELKPEKASVLKNGKIYEVAPEDVNIGDTIVVKPGERIPLDGEVCEGNSQLDVSAITGESLPAEIIPGDKVLSGSTNLKGVIKIKVENVFSQSAVSKILDMVQNSNEKKAKTEKFITRFARVYTPAVVGAALLLILIPSIFTGFSDSSKWLYRGLLFLVVSCPCALVISVPLSFFSGIGAASKKGILIKGAKSIESLEKCRTLAIDKTGTLTKGKFTVVDIIPKNISKEDLLELSALSESGSTHPIGESLVKEYGKKLRLERVSEVSEISGNGIKCRIDGKEVLCGKKSLLENAGIKTDDTDAMYTAVYISVSGKYAGVILLGDEIKEDSPHAVKSLEKLGVETVLLTGDKKSTADSVAKKIGIKKVCAELLPEDKVSQVEKLIENQSDGFTAFAGDGINDAPVIARADIGIAMGGLGSDIAIEAADVVLMNDTPKSIPQAIKISKKTMSIVRENIVFALVVKLAVMILGSIGLAGMWAAVFADVGVSFIAILNALRANSLKDL